MTQLIHLSALSGRAHFTRLPVLIHQRPHYNLPLSLSVSPKTEELTDRDQARGECRGHSSESLIQYYTPTLYIHSRRRDTHTRPPVRESWRETCTYTHMHVTGLNLMMVSTNWGGETDGHRSGCIADTDIYTHI